MKLKPANLTFGRGRLLSIGFLALLLCILIFASFFSAKSYVSSLEQFNKWLNNEDHKCIVTRRVGGVAITVKYYPPLYNVLQNTKQGIHVGQESSNFDRNLAQQNQMLTFLMTIGPDKTVNENRQAASVMSEGIDGYPAYIQRVLSTNFYMDQYISLFIDGVKYKPVLSMVENVYELSEQRSFVIVFVSEGGKNVNDGKDYVFEYDDPFFNIGKIQFAFRSENLLAARKIEFKK